MAWGVSGRLLATALTLVAVATACMPEEPPAPEPPPPPKVFVVYGDSLVVESHAILADKLTELLPGWEIVFRIYGGTAQCDFHQSMIDDAAALNVGGVAIAFAGNNLTPCIQARSYVTGYTEDANWAASFWGGREVPLLFVAAPGTTGTTTIANSIANAYTGVGAARGVAVVDAAPMFAQGSPAVFTFAMPCLVGECTSTIAVRRSQTDGHFCLLGASCPPTYSSGAVRYAEVITVGIAQILGVPHAPLRAMVPPP